MNTTTLIDQEQKTGSVNSKVLESLKIRNSKERFADIELLAGIKQRDNKTLEFIYDQCYPMILDLVLKHSGSEEDARDIFQDAMVIIYNKVKKDELVLFCGFRTYLYSICKRLNLKYIEQRRKASMVVYNMPKPVEEAIEYEKCAYEDEVEKYNIFQHHLLDLKEDARKLLKLYMENYSFKEICSIMGYKSESYAKTRKFAFKEELKRKILDDPYYRRFYEACA